MLEASDISGYYWICETMNSFSFPFLLPSFSYLVTLILVELLSPTVKGTMTCV